MTLSKIDLLRMIITQKKNIQFYSDRIEFQNSENWVEYHYLGYRNRKYSNLDIEKSVQITKNCVTKIKSGSYKIVDYKKISVIERQILSTNEKYKKLYPNDKNITLAQFKHIVFKLNANSKIRYSHKEVFEVIENKFSFFKISKTFLENKR